MSFDEIKTLANNWIRPRLLERKSIFEKGVQARLGEVVARGQMPSHSTYEALEDLARKELYALADIFIQAYGAGYKKCSVGVSRLQLQQLREEIDRAFVDVLVDIRGTIKSIPGMVSEGRPDVTDLRWPVVDKIMSE